MYSVCSRTGSVSVPPSPGGSSCKTGEDGQSMALVNDVES